MSSRMLPASMTAVVVKPSNCACSIAGRMSVASIASKSTSSFTPKGLTMKTLTAPADMGRLPSSGRGQIECRGKIAGSNVARGGTHAEVVQRRHVRGRIHCAQGLDLAGIGLARVEALHSRCRKIDVVTLIAQ